MVPARTHFYPCYTFLIILLQAPAFDTKLENRTNSRLMVFGTEEREKIMVIGKSNLNC
jgi:hypothetical protein